MIFHVVETCDIQSYDENDTTQGQTSVGIKGTVILGPSVMLMYDNLFHILWLDKNLQENRETVTL